ncbi:Formylglycine-generating enzyme, required for sulfatase activity, contains SUMF1/FGE domain [Chryseobacterium oleae]|uniref:Formylglycine-generating enzyme, required for sulfatase activity, contains SUMF1/FGE domain n=1 Tax=Chryseobacterium oleae TaxID=491207 RepID=A0A1I4YT86_CHROL|nr:SUMF1/EgtB/PvdO family nonheme iron enzyme [Chryseobacterium oleae]SFN40840.1 Formylglycine-generating enzyme, required for sulfatase activity, contains SUMF1/FGE domain [Chryseobacterium oleae]
MIKKVIFFTITFFVVNSCSQSEDHQNNCSDRNPEFELVINELTQTFKDASDLKTWPKNYCDATYKVIYEKANKALSLIKKDECNGDFIENLTQLSNQAKGMIQQCPNFENNSFPGGQLSNKYLRADMSLWGAQFNMLRSPSYSSTKFMQLPPVKDTKVFQPFEVIKDCSGFYCTEMVVLPIGNYFIGGTTEQHQALNVDSYRVAWESPRHQVKIGKSFAISKTEVTVDQYAEFVRETNRKEAKGALGFTGQPQISDPEFPMYHENLSWRNPGFPQKGDFPVTCVTRKDAEDYAAWLSSKTGAKYRLPTEAEWEYAAKAGSNTAFFWGDNVNDACGYAAVYDESTDAATGYQFIKVNCNDGAAYTASVGSFKPNNWGLYDVTGNAREFVADAWEDSYNTGPYNELPRTLGVSQFPVLRGGGWDYMPQNIRTSYRSAYYSWLIRSNMWGFRLVRELNT